MGVVTEQLRCGIPGLAGRYVEFCLEHLGELDEHVRCRDTGAVRQIAHILRGNAGDLGLGELSSLARRLEDYCAGTDWEAIASACEAIHDTVSALCDATPLSIEVRVHPPQVAELPVKVIG